MKPQINHCTPDKLKIYESFFGIDSKFTSEVETLIQKSMTGVRLSDSDIGAISYSKNHQKPSQWFESGRGWCLVPGTPTYVDTDANNFQPVFDRFTDSNTVVSATSQNKITNRNIFRDNNQLHKLINDSITNDDQANMVNHAYHQIYKKLKEEQVSNYLCNNKVTNTNTNTNTLFSTLPGIDKKKNNKRGTTISSPLVKKSRNQYLK